MSENRVATSSAPEVTIGMVQGSLSLKGWERNEVQVRASSNDFQLEEQDDVVSIASGGDCDVRLPFGATLTIETVQGDARIKLLEDQLTIEQVQGSLSLRNAGDVEIGTVHGNFSARHIAGDLQVDAVQGSAQVRDVQGDCQIDQVGGSLEVRSIEGSLAAAASGNLDLRLDVIAGDSYALEVGGNAYCRIPTDANLDLALASGAHTIQLRLPGDSRRIDQADASLTLGEGGVDMEVSAGGSLYISAQTIEWSPESTPEEVLDSNLSQRIAEQIDAHMDLVGRQLNEHMERLNRTFEGAGYTAEQTERMIRQAQEATNRAAARTEDKLRRAQEKLERKLETARRRAERRSRGRRSSTDWAAPFPAEPESEPVSDNERLAILQMLEQKKITVEQAEELLSALEGEE